MPCTMQKLTCCPQESIYISIWNDKYLRRRFTWQRLRFPYVAECQFHDTSSAVFSDFKSHVPD